MRNRICVLLLLPLIRIVFSPAAALGQTPVLPDSQSYAAYTRERLRDYFPDVVLSNQENKGMRFYQDVIKDRVVLIQFMFTKCSNLCPVTTPNLVRAYRILQQLAPGKVTFVSITVDPEHDKPRTLKAYAEKFKISREWKLLTGSKEDVNQIRRKLGVYDTDQDRVQHMNVLTLGNEAEGKWLSMEALAKPDDIAQTVLRLLPHEDSPYKTRPIGAGDTH